jgi:co-chaperonin GroES (HSP10)
MSKQHEPMEVIDRRTKLDTEPASEEAQTLVLEPELSLVDIDRVYDDPLPIFDRVLIRRNAEATTFAGTSFFIPESARKSANRGVVVTTAKFYIVEGKSFPMKELVVPGDIVTFSGFNTEDIELDEGTFTLCSVFDLKLIEKCHFKLGVS